MKKRILSFALAMAMGEPGRCGADPADEGLVIEAVNYTLEHPTQMPTN